MCVVWPKIVTRTTRAGRVTLQTQRRAKSTVGLRSNSARVRRGSSSRRVQCSPFFSPPFPPFSLCLSAKACHTGETLAEVASAGLVTWHWLAISYTLSSVRSTTLFVRKSVRPSIRHESQEKSGSLSVLLKGADAVCSSRLGPEAATKGDPRGHLQLLRGAHRVEDGAQPGSVQEVPRGEGVVAPVDSSHGHRQ